MHNSMKAAAEYLTDALVNKGVVVSLYNLTKTDIGNLAMDLLDASTVVLCAPTVLAGAHPTAAATAYLFNALRPKTKFLSLVTGYSWAERAQESLAGFVKSIKPEIVEPVKINGFPKKADFEALDKLALAIIEKHKQIGVMK
jgi:flavorubredoxin